MAANRWDASFAKGLTGLGLLAYRSRLLASDRSIVNIYGGNTSSKSAERLHTGEEAQVLWVKGSGRDMAACTEADFTGLRLQEVLLLIEREEMSDEEMVTYLARCAIEPGRPRQSIETLLHAFVPFREVDHTHPDAVVAIACTQRGRDAAAEVFGERAVWIDYVRPGFALSKLVAQSLHEMPTVECVILGKHGLVTWGSDSQSCYERTIGIVSEAEEALRSANRRVWTAAAMTCSEVLPEAILPELRGAICKERKKVVRLDQSKRVLQMVNSSRAKEVALVGAACPDHLVHTKRLPLFMELDFGRDLGRQISESVANYEQEYALYFERHARGERMFDAGPRVTLIPSIGMVTAGRNVEQAEVSRQLYHRAIEVMEGAEAMGGFVSLSEEESFDIEYWPLELYKLTQRPAERELEGHVAIVTGGGSGIGRATAIRFAEEGAHVCIVDIRGDACEAVAGEIAERFGESRAIAVQCDVCNEEEVMQAFARCVLEWGGLDILVCSAGIASSAPIEETTLEDWERTFQVLARGYFLPSREAFRIWRRQGIGGSLVFVTSKNAIAAGKNASAYSAAKAAEQHLARCLAEEGGPIGVRVNTVLPDAVIQGSSIWDSEWRAQRAASYGISPGELEEFYRERTTLKQSVLPEDVAEAILFLAGPRSAKTTGAALTVDAGVPGTYVR